MHFVVALPDSPVVEVVCFRSAGFDFGPKEAGWACILALY